MENGIVIRSFIDDELDYSYCHGVLAKGMEGKSI